MFFIFFLLLTLFLPSSSFLLFSFTFFSFFCIPVLFFFLSLFLSLSLSLSQFISLSHIFLLFIASLSSLSFYYSFFLSLLNHLIIAICQGLSNAVNKEASTCHHRLSFTKQGHRLFSPIFLLLFHIFLSLSLSLSLSCFSSFLFLLFLSFLSLYPKRHPILKRLLCTNWKYLSLSSRLTDLLMSFHILQVTQSRYKLLWPSWVKLQNTMSAPLHKGKTLPSQRVSRI